jgi:hypothetical protein
MTIRKGTLNNHPIIEDSTNPGVPITGDIVGSNAGIVALAGLAFTSTTNPTASDDGVGTAGNGRFGVPSFWTNTADSGSMYVCTDNSTTGANWVSISDPSVNPSGNVEAIDTLTQAQYDLLNPPDPNTLYIIQG